LIAQNTASSGGRRSRLREMRQRLGRSRWSSGAAVDPAALLTKVLG
jgi:hypothetical protein